jgi:hypothetical protein
LQVGAAVAAGVFIGGIALCAVGGVAFGFLTRPTNQAQLLPSEQSPDALFNEFLLSVEKEGSTAVLANFKEGNAVTVTLPTTCTGVLYIYTRKHRGSTPALEPVPAGDPLLLTTGTPGHFSNVGMAEAPARWVGEGSLRLTGAASARVAFICDQPETGAGLK